jgi:hypothetical protein
MMDLLDEIRETLGRGTPNGIRAFYRPDKELLADALGEIVRLQTRLKRVPQVADVELALLANNMDGLEFKPDYCQCDASVGMSPCPYCAIDSVLQRLLQWHKAAEAAGEER